MRFKQINFTSLALLNESIYAAEVPFFSMILFFLFFFNVEFKAFSNMEELYLNANEINDFGTTNGMIGYIWIKIKHLLYMVPTSMFWYILFCRIDSNILSKLQLLDLSETKISIRILESSAAFPSLRTLYLTYNNLKGSFTTEGKFMWHYISHITILESSSWWYFALFLLSLA